MNSRTYLGAGDGDDTGPIVITVGIHLRRLGAWTTVADVEIGVDDRCWTVNVTIGT